MPDLNSDKRFEEFFGEYMKMWRSVFKKSVRRDLNLRRVLAAGLIIFVTMAIFSYRFSGVEVLASPPSTTSQSSTSSAPASQGTLDYSMIARIEGVPAYYDCRTGLKLEPKYNLVGDGFSEGLCAARDPAATDEKRYKFGYIDRFGKVVIDFQFADAGPFSDGRAVVRRGKQGDEVGLEFAVIDTTGKFIVPYGKYDWIYDFSDGVAVCKSNDSRGFIDVNGKYIQPQYYISGTFKDGLCPLYMEDVDSDNNTGGTTCYIDKTGKIVFTLAKGWVGYSFYCQRAAIYNSIASEDPKKYGFIDQAGKTVIEPQYTGIGNFSEELAAVSTTAGGWCIDGVDYGPAPVDLDKEGLWGFIDTNGKLVIPMEYDKVGYFHEGLAMVFKDGKWGFINKEGKVVIECKYSWVSRFNNGVAGAIKDKTIIIIDKTGKEMVDTGQDLPASF